jgi:uncharacterized protein
MDNNVNSDFCLLIKPTGPDCNLRCEYCFYTGTQSQLEPGVHRMPEQTLEVLIRKMMQLHLPQSSFCWQGGEPTLMGLDWFKKVVELQKKYGTSGQSVSNAIQTNGILIDDSWAKFLNEYHFLTGISLDGLEKIHDAYRGKGTHKKVMNAVEILCQNEVDFNILCVVNNLNQNLGAETYRWFREQNFDFLQFIPAVETDDNYKPFTFSPDPQGLGRFLCDVFDAWLADGGPGKVYVRFFETLLGKMVTGRASGNCILDKQCGKYLVIEHDGDVYPCDFFVTPDLKIGNITDTEIPELLSSEKLQNFGRAKSQLAEQCQICQYLNLCNGGCLKDRQRMWGDFEGKTSYLCESYKIFFQHALPWFQKKADEILTEHRKQKNAIAIPAPPTKKAKRNDPCPCGSGKKFKHCCACSAEGN